VQVGSFGVPENARRAEARLAALGLPVRTVRGASGGRTLEIVRAGPFATGEEAQAALRAARAAGFGDAILRR
jgi:cell division protein FtsN